MAERPIIFSGESVRAILDGRKTQTRRVAALPSEPGCFTVGHYAPSVIDRHGDEQPGPEIFGVYHHDGDWGSKCPFGAPGDRLWVRESFFDHGAIDGHAEQLKRDERVEYRAEPWERIGEGDDGPWRSPIHMPRWASRLALEITDVRVQRVQDISESDCIAEGVEVSDIGRIEIAAGLATATIEYSKTWNALNAKRGFSWSDNPWVWAITFRASRAAAPPPHEEQHG